MMIRYFRQQQQKKPIPHVLSNEKKIHKKLGNEFVQCHKSYLVNLNNVICIKENTIELKNEVTLPIGNKYKQNLYNLIYK